VPLSEPAKAILSKLHRTDRRHVFGQDDTGYWGWPMPSQDSTRA
jgi:hypothetical protein